MQKELLKKFKCGPRPTIIIPIITQIPVFVAMSMLCARIAAPPTPLDGESFLTLSTLAHTDPTMVLPVVVGMLTLANVEASSWFLTAEQLAKQKEQERKIVEKAREKGKPPIVVEKVVKGAMRGLSVVRILITSVMPGVSRFMRALYSTLIHPCTERGHILVDVVRDWTGANRRLQHLGPAPKVATQCFGSGGGCSSGSCSCVSTSFQGGPSSFGSASH